MKSVYWLSGMLFLLFWLIHPDQAIGKERFSCTGQCDDYPAFGSAVESQLPDSLYPIVTLRLDGEELGVVRADKKFLNFYLPHTYPVDRLPFLAVRFPKGIRKASVTGPQNLTGSPEERTAAVILSPDGTLMPDTLFITFDKLPELDLFLVIGQSNMAGRGYVDPSQGDLEPVEGAWLFTHQNNWEPASNPLNKYSSVRKEMSMQRIGPSYGFARFMALHGVKTIGLVVNARGGTNISQWQKGVPGSLYDAALVRMKEALKWGRVRAILWHQGESDSGRVGKDDNPEQPDSYSHSLCQMVNDFRNDLQMPGLPFIAGELAYWRGEGLGSVHFNRMIRSISEWLPHSDWISAEGATPLMDDRDPHFSREGNLLLGERYAEKVLRMVYQTSSIFSPPPPFASDYGDFSSPLLFRNGDTVKTQAGWEARRREILRDWHHLMGEWPALVERQQFEFLDSIRRENIIQWHVRFQWVPGQMTDGYLLVPDGKGNRPAVITVFYDPETAAGLNDKPYRDFAWQLAKRGFVTLSLGTREASLRQEFSIYYPDIQNAAVQPLSMLACAAANAWEVLARVSGVDSARIGITGHSFGGKWAMFASCLYEKFACAAWSDPGIVFGEERPSVNYWEPWYLGYHPKPWRNRGLITADNPAKGLYPLLRAKGFDLTELHSLMAPRPFLVSGGSEDPVSRWVPLNHAIKVNRLLGQHHRVAMTNRPDHSPNKESNEQIFRFFEYFLKP